MSLEGGLDEVEESFFSRATSTLSWVFSAFSCAFSVSNSASLLRNGATAASIIASTCSWLNHFAMHPYVNNPAPWRNTTSGGGGVNAYTEIEIVGASSLGRWVCRRLGNCWPPTLLGPRPTQC